MELRLDLHIHSERSFDGCMSLSEIVALARERGLNEIEGLVLANNPGMLKLMRSLGFSIKAYAEDPDFKFVTHKL